MVVIAATLGIGAAPVTAGGDYQGTGIVSGTATYGRPLPGVLQTCAPKLPVTIRLSSPGFVLKTPTGVEVVPLEVSASGTAWCESEGSGGATLHTVTITAGGLRCTVPGGYTRFGSWIQLLASGRYCAVDADGDGTAEATANGYSWLFELSYAHGGMLSGTVVYQPY